MLMRLLGRLGFPRQPRRQLKVSLLKGDFGDLE